jgi:hypothetical protein
MITPPTPPEDRRYHDVSCNCPRCGYKITVTGEPGLGTYCDGCGFPMTVDPNGKLIAIPKEALAKTDAEGIKWLTEDNDEFCNKKGWWG